MNLASRLGGQSLWAAPPRGDFCGAAARHLGRKHEIARASVSAEASQLGTRLDSGSRGAQFFDAEESRVAPELLGGVLT